MGAFLGISLWVALATVVPGLVTIAALYGAYVFVNPSCLRPYAQEVLGANDWVWAGVGITIMVLTQALGILLEGLLIRKRLLGPELRKLQIAEGIDPHHETQINLRPYFEYNGLYILLAELREDEDTQGHLKRALAQFFLTNNTLVSFSAGIILSLVFYSVTPTLDALFRACAYIIFLSGCLFISFKVARIRFEVMAKALWAARRRRLHDPGPGEPPANKAIQPTR